MIIDARTGDAPDEIEADIGIFGAGAMGIALARELAGTGRRLVLVESGGETIDADVQALNETEVEGLRPLLPPDLSRLRYLGGTTNHWGGWSRPFSRKATAEWPIPYEEMSSRFARVNRLLELLNRDFDDLTSFPRFDDQFFADYGPGLITGVRQIREVRMWPVYSKELLARDNLRIVTNASVVDFDFAEDNESIAAARARTLNGRTLKIAAKDYVLTCGGLENPIILQNIDQIHHGLLSRKTGAIGRYYADHAEIEGRLYPFSCFIPALYQRFWWVDDIQQHHWTRMFVTLDPNTYPEFGEHPHAFELDPSHSFHAQCEYRSQRDYESLYARVPRDEGVRSEFCIMQFASTPNRESRITLSEKENGLGQRRGILSWRILEDDVARARDMAVAAEQRLAANGLARLRLSAAIDEKGLNRTTDEVDNACHHMGGTRMGVDPRDSVVDSDCRFHGLRNLFIAGPGVFPSFDWPGPTYTALTLTLRLADHLRAG